jgi:hypothetical protein
MLVAASKGKGAHVPTMIVHQPRVAWDFAQLVVDISTAPIQVRDWFAGELAARLGAQAREEFALTGARVGRDERIDIRPIEIGRWRARLEDALRTTNGLAEDLSLLRQAARVRVAR